MSERILTLDLTRETSTYTEYSPQAERPYGRGLALELLKEHVPTGAGRFSPDNALVLVPGLFVGNSAPSACRIMLATCEDNAGGMQICNMTGNIAQKLGSLGIAGVVIKGKAEKPGTVIHIDKDGASIYCDESLNGLYTSDVLRRLKSQYDNDSAIIGIGRSGDMMMPLSSFFCTYPDGEPEYHVPRNGFGDVWGSKNLRAIVVDSDGYFGRECFDSKRFSSAGKKLARIIVDDEICGSALPTYGSITIMKILEGGAGISALPEIARERTDIADIKRESSGKKTNKTCAPMCVIGCLNRHAASNGRKYSSPAQVETQAAIENCFGIDDYELANDVQKKASEIGLVATEFVTASNTYARALGIENAQTHLLEWLDEIAEGTPVGRVIACRTRGVAELYKDADLTGWLDIRASQEEDSFDIKIGSPYKGLKGLSELDMLYAQIFVLENLGICMFTSFALLDNTKAFDLLAEMFEARTGIETDGETLIRQADNCIKQERLYKEERWKAAQKRNIPQFTRVLYRYFGSRDEARDE